MGTFPSSPRIRLLAIGATGGAPGGSFDIARSTWVLPAQVQYAGTSQDYFSFPSHHDVACAATLSTAHFAPGEAAVERDYFHSNLPPLLFVPRVLYDFVVAVQGRVHLHGGRPYLNPFVSEAERLIVMAAQEAERNEQLLLVAYIGHGISVGYGMAQPSFLFTLPRGKALTGLIDVYASLRKAYLSFATSGQTNARIGLSCLVDACSSGVGCEESGWMLGTLAGRFTEVVASTGESESYAGAGMQEISRQLHVGLENSENRSLRLDDLIDGMSHNIHVQQPHRSERLALSTPCAFSLDQKEYDAHSVKVDLDKYRVLAVNQCLIDDEFSGIPQAWLVRAKVRRAAERLETTVGTDEQQVVGEAAAGLTPFTFIVGQPGAGSSHALWSLWHQAYQRSPATRRIPIVLDAFSRCDEVMNFLSGYVARLVSDIQGEATAESGRLADHLFRLLCGNNRIDCFIDGWHEIVPKERARLRDELEELSNEVSVMASKAPAKDSAGKLRFFISSRVDAAHWPAVKDSIVTTLKVTGPTWEEAQSSQWKSWAQQREGNKAWPATWELSSGRAKNAAVPGGWATCELLSVVRGVLPGRLTVSSPGDAEYTERHGETGPVSGRRPPPGSVNGASQPAGSESSSYSTPSARAAALVVQAAHAGSYEQKSLPSPRLALLAVLDALEVAGAQGVVPASYLEASLSHRGVDLRSTFVAQALFSLRDVVKWSERHGVVCTVAWRHPLFAVPGRGSQLSKEKPLVKWDALLEVLLRTALRDSSPEAEADAVSWYHDHQFCLSLLRELVRVGRFDFAGELVAKRCATMSSESADYWKVLESSLSDFHDSSGVLDLTRITNDVKCMAFVEAKACSDPADVDVSGFPAGISAFNEYVGAFRAWQEAVAVSSKDVLAHAELRGAARNGVLEQLRRNSMGVSERLRWLRGPQV